MGKKGKAAAAEEEAARLAAEEEARQEALRKEREAEEERARIEAERVKKLKAWNDGIVEYLAAQAENRRGMMLIFEDLHASIVERQKLDVKRAKNIQEQRILSARGVARRRTPRLPALPKDHNADPIFYKPSSPVVVSCTPAKCPFETSTGFRPRTGRAPPLTPLMGSTMEAQRPKTHGYSRDPMPMAFSIQSM